MQLEYLERTAGLSSGRWGSIAVAMLLVAIAEFIFVSEAAAGVIRDDVADSNYTALAAQPEFASVGLLKESGVARGSGTNIDRQPVGADGGERPFVSEPECN